VEGAACIANGLVPETSLSEQQLTSCVTTNFGCNGGSMQNAFEYIISNPGLCSDAAYPYTESNGTCTACSPVAYLTSYQNVVQNSDSQLMAAVAKTPVSIAIDGSSFEFQYYSGGIFNSSNCGDDLDHAVLAVGYGINEMTGQSYYILKNSWGSTWGEEGYMQIQMGMGILGECGMLLDNSYPTARATPGIGSAPTTNPTAPPTGNTSSCTCNGKSCVCTASGCFCTTSSGVQMIPSLWVLVGAGALILSMLR